MVARVAGGGARNRVAWILPPPRTAGRELGSSRGDRALYGGRGGILRLGLCRGEAAAGRGADHVGGGRLGGAGFCCAGVVAGGGGRTGGAGSGLRLHHTAGWRVGFALRRVDGFSVARLERAEPVATDGQFGMERLVGLALAEESAGPAGFASAGLGARQNQRPSVALGGSRRGRPKSDPLPRLGGGLSAGCDGRPG